MSNCNYMSLPNNYRVKTCFVLLTSSFKSIRQPAFLHSLLSMSKCSWAALFIAPPLTLKHGEVSGFAPDHDRYCSHDPKWYCSTEINAPTCAHAQHRSKTCRSYLQPDVCHWGGWTCELIVYVTHAHMNTNTWARTRSPSLLMPAELNLDLTICSSHLAGVGATSSLCPGSLLFALCLFLGWGSIITMYLCGLSGTHTHTHTEACTSTQASSMWPLKVHFTPVEWYIHFGMCEYRILQTSESC